MVPVVRRRKPLSVVPAGAPEGLGLETIMDRGLAARFGVPYVHLAAFAIDVDRVNAEVSDDPSWPAGWEVFLTEQYLLDRFDPARPEDRELVTDTCEAVMEGGQALGAQLPFAVWDAVERGAWPDDLRVLFRGWKRRPRELARHLAALWSEADTQRRRLVEAALAVPLEPPLAPPTREELERMRA